MKKVWVVIGYDRIMKGQVIGVFETEVAAQTCRGSVGASYWVTDIIPTQIYTEDKAREVFQ